MNSVLHFDLFIFVVLVFYLIYLILMWYIFFSNVSHWPVTVFSIAQDLSLVIFISYIPLTFRYIHSYSIIHRNEQINNIRYNNTTNWIESPLGNIIPSIHLLHQSIKFTKADNSFFFPMSPQGTVEMNLRFICVFVLYIKNTL